MTEELIFEKQGTSYVCKLSEGVTTGIIQVEFEGRGILSVNANIPGMTPSVVNTYENPYGNSVIIELDLPTGIEVTLRTSTKVNKALWMQ